MISRSSPADARLARTWIALLWGRLTASLAATSGVEVPADLARYLLAGADVVMTTSALLRHGPSYATDLLDALRRWMASKGFETVDDVRGLLGCRQTPTPPPTNVQVMSLQCVLPTQAPTTPGE